MYLYSSSGGFPTNSYNSGDYGVDVLFTLPKPGAVSNVAAIEAGATSANVTWSAPTTGGTPSSYTITPYEGTTALAPTTVAAPADHEEDRRADERPHATASPSRRSTAAVAAPSPRCRTP